MNAFNPQRFTLDGSEALEAQLTSLCQRVLEGVRKVVPQGELHGILLGGGYGRGEGGVLRTPTGDQPYNDLEFYVFVRGNAVIAERRFGPALARLGHALASGTGVEIEFKPITLRKLRESPPTMFYYDLVAGHRWLLGDEGLLARCDQHRDPAKIPLHEATRLLMNRCSGLLFSLEHFRRPGFGLAESDFVGRNLAKAQLAFGDVVLTARGEYHGSCRIRHERLLRQPSGLAVPSMDTVITQHQAGVAFKLHPVRSSESREALSLRHADLSNLGRDLWLWLESKRINRPFASATDYSNSHDNLCPETPVWKNLLLNLKIFKGRAFVGLPITRYPRERLLRALPLLLWRDLERDVSAMRRVQTLLNSRGQDFHQLIKAYERLWHRFN